MRNTKKDELIDLADFSNQERKLTSWKNEPTITALKVDLDAAKPSHKTQMSRISKWNDLMNIKGDALPPKVKDRSAIQPKLIRKQAEWRYSALSEPFLGSDKLFSVSPVTFEDGAAAKQNELVINYQFRNKINRVKLVDDYVRCVVDDGTSLIQTGWDRETKIVKQEVPVYSYYPIEDEEDLQMLQQVMELKTSDPRTYDEQVPPETKASVDFMEQSQQPAKAVQVGVQQVDVETIVRNCPTVVIHNPENVIIDPSCNGDLDKALFVIVSFETNKAELKKAGDRYKNVDKIDWENIGPTTTDSEHISKTPNEFQFKDSARKKVIAYEYWGYYDIEGNGILKPIVATWVGETMIRMEENPFPDEKLPFVLVTYSPVKRELYGEPDAELLEDNQKILGAVTRGIIDLLGKSANSQIGMAKGLLDPLNKRKFENGQDYEFNPQGNPLAQIIDHKYPEIPNSALTVMQLQNQEAESITGVKSFTGGISGESYGDVAAGIRGALDAASKREMAILRRLAQGIVNIGKKFISMNSAFLSEEEVIRITNTEFVTVKREELKGDFDLSVDISTAEIDDAQAQDLGFMLQTMGPNMDPGMSSFILGEIADLKRMPELANKLRTYKPEPDPMQQKLAELEIAVKEAELEKIKSEIAINNSRAEELSAKANQINQGLQDEVTGVKHQRELEKQKAQSKGNQNLQITKALTKPLKENESAPDIEAAIGYNSISDKLSEAGKNQQVIAQDPFEDEYPQEFVNDPINDPAYDPNYNL